MQFWSQSHWVPRGGGTLQDAGGSEGQAKDVLYSHGELLNLKKKKRCLACLRQKLLECRVLTQQRTSQGMVGMRHFLLRRNFPSLTVVTVLSGVLSSPPLPLLLCHRHLPSKNPGVFFLGPMWPHLRLKRLSGQSSEPAAMPGFSGAQGKAAGPTMA